MKECTTCKKTVSAAEEKACIHKECPQQITGTKDDILTVVTSVTDLAPEDFDNAFGGSSLLADLQSAGSVPKDLPFTLDTVPGHLL